jgi:hypothetical protein
MQRTKPATAIFRCVAAILLACSIGGLLTGCGGGNDLSAEEQALLDDERYGPETFESADYGAEIETEVDDRFRIYPSGGGGGFLGFGGHEGTLSLVQFGEGSEVVERLDNVRVDPGSVIAFRDYRIRVVTISDRGIAVQVAQLTE